MAGLIKSQIQLGDSATATQNFVLTSAAQDGTMKLSRGNFGVTTQDLMVVNAAGKVSFPQNTASMVRVYTANGFGSTNTKVRRFLSIITNTGTDITYTDSATLGATFTINTNGVYAISYTDEFANSSWAGITLNCSNVATMLQLLPVGEVLSAGYNSVATASTVAACTLYLPAGSVLRAQTDGNFGVGANNGNVVNFTIVRVA